MIAPKRQKLTPRESKQGYERAAERSFGLCECCGIRQAEQMHHRLRRGPGDERVENLFHICHACHFKAHHDSLRYTNGWQIRSGFDPAILPLMYRGRLTWLTADGGVEEVKERGEVKWR